MEAQKPVRIPLLYPTPHYLDLHPGKLYKCLQDGVETIVEYGYLSTGGPVCYEPGDSGGGMQSSFFIAPENFLGPCE